MTGGVWGNVPDGTEVPSVEEVDLGTWAAPPDDTITSAHDRQIASGKEEAAAYFVSRTLAGPWAPKPDLTSSPTYREAFEDELRRLEGERRAEIARRGAQLDLGDP